MKKYFFLSMIILSLLSADCIAQDNPQALILNPSGRAILLLQNYFNEGITNELLQQISPNKLRQIQQNCNESTYPLCFKKLIEQDEENNKLFQSLVTYRIATYDNIRGGENYGEQSILEVPANENKKLVGSDCEFDRSFYIIMYSKDIKIFDK